MFLARSAATVKVGKNSKRDTGGGFSRAPQLFEPRRIGSRVFDRVLNVAVSEIILNEPGIRALVGEGETASVAQHVRMSEEGQGSGAAVSLQEKMHRRSMQRLAAFTDKKRFDGRRQLHARAFFQPGTNHPELVGAQRMRCR